MSTGVFLAQVLIGEGLVLMMGSVMSLLSQNVWSLFVAICVYLVLAAISGFLINFIGAAWTVCTLVACYQDHSNLPAANRPAGDHSKPAERYLSVRRHHLARLDVGFLAVPTGQATSRLMREAHEKGLMVYAWTVNDVDGILNLMEIGWLSAERRFFYNVSVPHPPEGNRPVVSSNGTVYKNQGVMNLV